VIQYFVTDRRRFSVSCDDLVAHASRAARAGVTHIQIREHDLPDAALASFVRAVSRAVSGTGVRVLVNDRADVAIATGVAGVHLPSDSIAASQVRRIVPPGFLVGRSVHSLDDVDRAIEDGGCDYLLFGTVFHSSGKPAGHPVAGLDGLRAACARSPLPVIAIGGMSEAREPEVAAAGAAGLAGVGMFM
jgi:thiamine-phosphate pyrophosphorylase